MPNPISKEQHQANLLAAGIDLSVDQVWGFTKVEYHQAKSLYKGDGQLTALYHVRRVKQNRVSTVFYIYMQNGIFGTISLLDISRKLQKEEEGGGGPRPASQRRRDRATKEGTGRPKGPGREPYKPYSKS